MLYGQATHAVRDAEIERFPQIGDRGSKIAAIRLAFAATST